MIRPTTLDLSATPKAVSFSEPTKNDSFLSPGEVLYESESPDEAALVYAAKAYGISLMQRGPKHAVISWPKDDSAQYDSLKIRYLAVLPFDSARKMMSVLVENQKRDGGSILLTKGADSAIFSRLKKGEDFSKSRGATLTHVDNYAVDGLRNGL